MKILCVLFCLTFISCASIQYDAETGSFAYNRFGNQELIDLHVEKSVDGVKVDLGRQKSEREIAEIILGLEKNIDKALKILDELQRKIPKVF